MDIKKNNNTAVLSTQQQTPFEKAQQDSVSAGFENSNDLFAIIDIGSNTIRMDLFEIEQNTQTQTSPALWQTVLSTKASAGLAGYVENGILSSKGVDVLCKALLDCKKILQRLGCTNYIAAATASLRLLNDPQQVMEAVLQKTGIQIILLSGQDEARLSFEGARMGLRTESGVYMDTGGGSTELILFNGEAIQAACSLPAGSLNLYRDYVSGLLPSQAELDAINAHLETLFAQEAKAFEGIQADVLCITGGSMRAVRDVLADLGWIAKDQYLFKADLLDRLMQHLMADQAASSRLFVTLHPDRIHTILPSLAISCFLQKKFHAEYAEISLLGLRQGALQRHMSEKTSG